MAYSRILTVQDLSCLGQVSAAVALPVLSAWGHEACLLPTALLSTHTGFKDPYILNLSDRMPEIIHHWKREGILFDAILVGYLGSQQAISQVMQLVESMLTPEGLCIVDPVMADHGKLYRGFDMDYVHAMHTLCSRADIVLPNVTEAALLTGVPYPEKRTEGMVEELAARLPWENAVLTGAIEEGNSVAIGIKRGQNVTFHSHPRAPGAFSGTGDLFAACLTGGLMSGKKFPEAAAFAADFTGKCAMETAKNPAHSYGIRFEPFLGLLTKEAGEKK